MRKIACTLWLWQNYWFLISFRISDLVRVIEYIDKHERYRRMSNRTSGILKHALECDIRYIWAVLILTCICNQMYMRYIWTKDCSFDSLIDSIPRNYSCNSIASLHRVMESGKAAGLYLLTGEICEWTSRARWLAADFTVRKEIVHTQSTGMRLSWNDLNKWCEFLRVYL